MQGLLGLGCLNPFNIPVAPDFGAAKFTRRLPKSLFKHLKMPMCLGRTTVLWVGLLFSLVMEN